MAEKKKSPSTARPRGNKPAPAASPAVSAAPVVAAPVVSAPAASIPPVVAPPAAPAAPVAVARAPVAPVSLAGLEVDERPTIQMPAPPQAVPHHVLHERIAQRAHEIHRTRGGTAFDNWLQAERELGAR